MSTYRKNKGSTILVISFVLLICIIGVACFLLSKILGGANELTQASDSGILNAANQALITPSIKPNDPSLPPVCHDFFELSDPPGVASGSSINYQPISLLTYNRLVAQAILVANNAEQENLQSGGLDNAAVANARSVIAGVKAVGSYLQNQMNSGALDSAWSSLAQSNSVRMLGNANVALQHSLTTSYMNSGGSANIYFDPTVVNTVPINSGGSLKPSSSAGDPNSVQSVYHGSAPSYGNSIAYVAGYNPINLLSSTGTTETLFAVPTMPEQKSHLVSLLNFSTSTNAPDRNTPPNAFSDDCTSHDSTSNQLVRAISCAIVGSQSQHQTSLLAAATGTYYPGAIPAGYIRIINAPVGNANGTVIPAGNFNDAVAATERALNVALDGSTDLFNTVLAIESGGVVYVEHPGTGNPETTPFEFGSNAALRAWATYNDSTGSDRLGHNPDVDPLQSLGGSPYLLRTNAGMRSQSIRIGSQTDNFATLPQLLAIRAGTKMLTDVTFDGSEPAWADAMLPVLAGNFGCITNYAPDVADSSAGFTVIEWLKSRIIMSRANNSTRATINLPSNLHSGSKYFRHFTASGTLVHYATPRVHSAFGEIGTPLSLINDINELVQPTHQLNTSDAGYANFISTIAQRTKQINPSFNEQAVKTALNSAPLSLGYANMLYLHADPSRQRLVLDANVPYDNKVNGIPTLQPDGFNCRSTYGFSESQRSQWPDIGLSLVDTQKDPANGVPRGDMNFHNVPWKEMNESGFVTEPPTVAGSDAALNQALTAIKGNETTTFVPSSGFGNLLGELHFDTQVDARGSNTVFVSIPN